MDAGVENLQIGLFNSIVAQPSNQECGFFAISLALDPTLATRARVSTRVSAPANSWRCSLRFLIGLICLLLIQTRTTCAQEIEPAQKERATTTNRYLIVDALRYTWHLRPNAILEQNGIVYETNSFGLRDVEFSLAKPEGTLRIVCLGDSVTYGAGVSFEETYERQLEKTLGARGFDAKVVNAGIGSQCAWHGLERLEKDVIRFNPDMVAICFGLNDGALSSQTLWDEWKTKLAQRKSSGFINQQRIDSIHQGKSMRLVPSVPLAEFETHLRTLVAQLRTRTQAKVYLLTFNSVSEDYQNSQWSPELRRRQRSVYGEYRHRVLEIARKMKLKSADVYQRFERSEKSLLNPDGIHPNAEGMAVYADELFKQILSDLGVR